MAKSLAQPNLAAGSIYSQSARLIFKRHRSLIIQPILILTLAGVLFLVLSNATLDVIEKVTINPAFISAAIKDHLILSFASAAIIMSVAVPAGILLTRKRFKKFTPLVLVLANIGQAFPAVGVLILAGILYGFGKPVAIFSFAAFGILPILRNTIVGLQEIDPFIIESAMGMGMTSKQALRQIELPLAVPVILAGVRTTLILTVGVATLGVFVNGGGLGTLIIPGLKLNRDLVLVTGGLLTVIVAFTMDWLARAAEELLRPRGI
jgi:ABC-type proline/glycine betaine transport system permease subunit